MSSPSAGVTSKLSSTDKRKKVPAPEGTSTSPSTVEEFRWAPWSKSDPSWQERATAHGQLHEEHDFPKQASSARVQTVSTRQDPGAIRLRRSIQALPEHCLESRKLQSSVGLFAFLASSTPPSLVGWASLDLQEVSPAGQE